MKMNASIGLVVAIGLSLFAARAGAQSDSLHYHVSLKGNSIFYFFTETMDCHGTSEPGPWHSGYIPCLLDETATVKRTDTISGSDVRFVIDTTTDQIKNLVVSLSNYQSLYNGWGEEEQTFRISFDSIYYHLLSNQISVPRNLYHTDASFSERYTLSHTDGCIESGMWDSSALMLETLEIEISGNSGARVNPERVHAINLKIVNKVDGELEVDFAPREYASTIDISNIIGNEVRSFAVPSQSSMITTSTALFPPGCYFARLGDQVAKFVVPPR